ncbi:MAG TPA: A24 family peptidase [Steroidobacteraceae bacterium]|jgi:leader peptidase (prepilin peptidase) / N-methyltransferase|nr:A24 family peptidase [Steroidobacteraceae bacterium]
MSVIALLAGSPALFIGTCVVLGLVVGSFLNVVIYRLPIMLDRQWRAQCADVLGEAAVATVAAGVPERFDLLVPRSACPACRAPIPAAHNIPLISWLILRGRCARCGAAISVRYPIVELLTGVLSGLVAWKLGFGWPALAALVFTWFLIALTCIDLDTQLLPDSLTLPLLWIGLTLALFASRTGGAPVPVDLPSSVIGAIGGYVSLWSVYHLFRLLTGKEGMGYGDFKLFAALGAWLGWQMLLPVILIAAAAGAVVGITVLSVRRQHSSTPIAFGPFLAASGWLMLMVGRELVERYLGLFVPHP